jgi:hypothetical protein
MLLVGSRALAKYLCGGAPRIPKDWDYICTHDEAKTFIAQLKPDRSYPNQKGTTLILRWRDEHTNQAHQPIELMIAWPGSTTEEIYNLEKARLGCTEKCSEMLACNNRHAASLNTLYLLKMSHRFMKNSPHFLKTMQDIQMMRLLGATIEDPELLKRRESETYDYRHPSLMRNKRQFFDPNEGVGYKYDHDTIHLAMAVEAGKPAYTYFKADQAEVMVDKALFDAQPYSTQLNSVYEEATVLALERSQIPHRNKIDPRASFEIALMKVCTSISSGWWRSFAWENYDAVLKIFEAREKEKPYLLRFDEAVRAGVILPFSGNMI